MPTSEALTSLLRSSSERVRSSRSVAATSRKCIRQSQAALLRSKELLSHPLNTGWVSYEPAARNASPQGTHPANETSLERITARHLIGEVVCLDSKHFQDCFLENCILEYSGQPVIVQTTRFSGCRFRFSREAAMTVSLLECFGMIGSNTIEYMAFPPTEEQPNFVN